VICYSSRMSDPDEPSGAELAALYRTGKSIRVIAGMHPSLSYARVRGILLAHNVELRGNGGARGGAVVGRRSRAKHA
jgi:hypothetical protein